MGKAKIFDTPRLFFTDKHCVFGDGDLERPSVGFLADEYGKPIYPVIRWLMIQRVRRPNPDDDGTIKQLAADLRMFWEFLSRENKDWREVNDRFLSLWRDRMVQGIRVSKAQRGSDEKKNAVNPIRNGTINRRTATVLRFYIWAKEQEIVDEKMVGTGGKFRLLWEYGGKNNKQRVWVGKLKEEESAPSALPDDDDIDKLHDALSLIFTRQTSARNRLYVEWNRYVGLRGLEAASLKVHMIPSAEDIQPYIDAEKPYPLDFSPRRQGVRTKGGKDRPHPLDVDPMLLMQTRQYIDTRRPTIVERAKNHFGRTYKKSDAVFLSTSGETLGQQIKTKTIQEAISKAIKGAGLNITPHGLRKVFAMQVVLDLYLGKYMSLQDKGVEMNHISNFIDDNSIITYASQQLGHKFTTTTIKHYLDTTKLKMFAMSDRVRLQYLERHKKNALAAHNVYESSADGDGDGDGDGLMRKYALAHTDGLQKALDDGDNEKVINILKKHFHN